MNEEKCDVCNHEIIFIKTPENIHYGKKVCERCNKHFGWVKKPENEQLRTKTSCLKLNQIMEHKKMVKPFCEFCLRTKERLGVNETFEIDHIIPLSMGGNDEITNVSLLCSSCHRLKHHEIIYSNKHILGEIDVLA